jgi:replicative DNA helicase
MEGLDEEWDDYLRRKAGSGMLGYSTGFPTIDKTTLGLQSGHLVTVLAQHKVGKTTLCLAIANHVYLTYEVPVLFCSFEMGTYEMRLRQRSLMARINFAHLQSGRLSSIEEKTYYDHLDDIETRMTWPFEFMDASSGSTVSAIHAHIQKRKPKLVVIDGIYMIHDEVTGEVNTAQALTNVTRALKRLATQEGIPIVINTQALGWKSRGQKISTDSAGYSSSFGQDSDVVLGLERYDTKDDDKASARQTWRRLRVLASRNSGLDEVELTFDYDTGTVEEDV